MESSAVQATERTFPRRLRVALARRLLRSFVGKNRSWAVDGYLPGPFLTQGKNIFLENWRNRRKTKCLAFAKKDG